MTEIIHILSIMESEFIFLGLLMLVLARMYFRNDYLKTKLVVAYLTHLAKDKSSKKRDDLE